MKARDNETISSKMAMPIPVGRAIYEWICIVLLLTGAIVGPIIFGAVRLWSFGGLAVLAMLGCLMAFALALRTDKGRYIFAPPGSIAFLIFLLYVLVRVPFSPITYEARVEFLKIASLCATYFAWMLVLDRPGRWRILCAITLLVGSGISLYAFTQLNQDPIMVLGIVEADGGRVGGTYVSPNHYSAYIEILVCLALSLLIMKSSGWVLKIFSAYGLLTFLPGIYFSGTRAAWIGTVVGVSVMALLWCWRRSVKLLLIMIVVLPILLGSLSFIVWNSSEMVRDRIDRMIRVQETDDGVSYQLHDSRLSFWSDTIDMIKTRPAFGYGAGSYRYVFPQYMQMVFPRFLRYAHNDYLHHTAEYGIVGFILFAFIIIVGAVKYLIWIKRTDRDRSACLAIGLMGAFAATLAHCFFDFNLQYYSNNHVLILFAAITASSFFSTGDFKPREISWSKYIWIAAIVVSAAIMIAQAVTLASYVQVRRGNWRQERMELPEAEKFYRSALRIDSGNWNAHLQLGHVFRTMGRWELDPEMKLELLEQARAHYDHAQQGNPFDIDPRFGISQVYLALGDRDTAIELQRQITEDFPAYIFYHIRYAVNLRRAGRHEESLAAFQRARRLSPSDQERSMIDLNIRQLRRIIRESR